MPVKKSKGNQKTPAFKGLTHPNRILDPLKTITKQDLAEYYQAISPWILPHLIDRPLTLLRCPAGSKTECFYQKHYSKGFGDAVFPIAIREKTSKSDYLTIKDQGGLLALVQLNVLELHPWGSKAGTLESPDRVTFDLDPDSAVKWDRVIEAALYLKKFLNKLGLKSFVKTSGGKGLHIVVPIQNDVSWKEVKLFARSVAQFMESQYPEQYIALSTKAKRKGKIYIDYLRNMRGATTVATYSTRARPGAPISTPLRWEELKQVKAGDQFTIQNILKRISGLKTDPWKGFLSLQQSIKKLII